MKYLNMHAVNKRIGKVSLLYYTEVIAQIYLNCLYINITTSKLYVATMQLKKVCKKATNTAT